MSSDAEKKASITYLPNKPNIGLSGSFDREAGGRAFCMLFCKKRDKGATQLEAFVRSLFYS